MIKWETILTSVLLSGTLVSLIVFLFKKTLEKGIETKFKEVENKQRLHLEETQRRQGKIFDDQYDICKSIIGLTYRVRNVSREIVELLEKYDYNNLILEDILTSQNDYFRSLRDLMLDNRAILPEHVFKELHDLSHCVNDFNSSLRMLFKRKNSISTDEVKNIIGRAKERYRKIDEHYLVMTGIVHTSLGVTKK